MLSTWRQCLLICLCLPAVCVAVIERITGVTVLSAYFTDHWPSLCVTYSDPCQR
jgi:hypothetical protein